ncbi:MAG: TATA-box-binding protein, partial [Archaeoglobaceae archaeon]|nr:TATA-box-binding protein [Archaeoglobaceae archaeon]
VLRINEPKAAALVFRSGKIVCTGSKSVDDARRAVRQIIKMLKGIGISVIDEPDVKVQNIVASADLGTDLNLNAIAVGLGLENVEYEPEQFPGLVYRLRDPRVVVLIFGSGKMVVTGGKSPEDAQKAVEKISSELRMLGLM